MQSLIQGKGGIGVFLLGLVVMTEGLQALAGARISQWLAEATRSPCSGAVTGAVGTAIKGGGISLLRRLILKKICFSSDEAGMTLLSRQD